MNDSRVLARAAELARQYLDDVADRPVRARLSAGELRALLGGPLGDDGEDAAVVIERLARDADGGLMASAGPRYFGFVIGGSHPVSVAADWLTSAWDQNSGLYAATPAVSVIEETASAWLRELFGLPAQTSVGFVTGCQMANFTGLAAARHAVLERVGWNVELRGLYGAPEIQVVLGAEAHVTVFSALQFLGLGRERVTKVAVDAQGRMLPEALRETLAGLPAGPTIVCAQVGNVNSGACDPVDAIADAAAARGAWLHVDGAFGLWAATTPELRHLVRGVERADSWATDAHKWLNVPYDCGLAMCAHPDAHRAAMTTVAPYLVQTRGSELDPLDWAPEFSRRGRGVTVYATLRHLGRRGVAELIERGVRMARRIAGRLGAAPGVEILNEVVLNQVLVRFHPLAGDSPAAADALTRQVVSAVQEDGTCWLSGSTWHGMAVMRVSVSNWSTGEDDVDRSADAILGCLAQASRK
jgi:glutamate/tyrosine decarboxylase-like PLP-dependent enzyme